MEMKPHNPASIFKPVGSYVHAMEVIEAKRLMFITGTMGINKEGALAEGIDAQCKLVWENIRAILEDAGMTIRNLVKINCYLADRSYREANMKARAAVLGDHRIANTVIVSELLEDGWLVEIEAIAAA